MSDIAIRIEGVGKQYRLGTVTKAYDTLRDSFNEIFARLMRKDRAVEEAERYFWALRNVSLEIKQGEVLGVIGRNGAGKSTLLKILSRITWPTEGRVELNGRVGTLLEVGTGFHPELTGRENVFLNGAILGMTKAEIRRKFDEIVDFAEVEKFLDTPVKKYSSGMRVRLGFAVAAHLNPEILLVDEVLAVGDVAFQNKCLNKMDDVTKAGRTILFVSHNMGAVGRLCRRIIWLDQGNVVEDGPSESVLLNYLGACKDHNGLLSKNTFSDNYVVGDDFVQLREISLVSQDGNEQSRYGMNESLSIRFTYEVLKEIENFHLYIRVHTEEGILAFCSADWDETNLENRTHAPGTYIHEVTIPAHFLNTGKYLLTAVGLIPDIRFIFQESPALIWEITQQGGSGGLQSLQRQGILRPMLRWRSLSSNG